MQRPICICSAADVQAINHLTLELQQGSFNALQSCWLVGVFLVTLKILEKNKQKKTCKPSLMINCTDTSEFSTGTKPFDAPHTRSHHYHSFHDTKTEFMPLPLCQMCPNQTSGFHSPRNKTATSSHFISPIKIKEIQFCISTDSLFLR